VNGLLTKTVAKRIGRFSRNVTPNMAHKMKCRGSSGVGGTNAMNNPMANALATLCRLNVQQHGSIKIRANGRRNHLFSSTCRFGVTRFSQRRIDLLCRFRLTLTLAPLTAGDFNEIQFAIPAFASLRRHRETRYGGACAA
jgi:hypothetical protein